MSWFSTVNRFSDPVGASRIALYVDLISRFPTGHLVDLGAGHGIFSQIALDLGWRVTAVDARDERFPSDADITWTVADVRDFDGYADVDLVVCLGLWYHLTAADQRALARRIYPRPLILDTHVAVRNVPRRFKNGVTAEFVREGPDEGRYYDEQGFTVATASWGNPTSFWPTVRSLESQLYDAGYEVFEQISPPYLPDRGFFVARNLACPGGVEGLESVLRARGPREVQPEAPATPRKPLSLSSTVADWTPAATRNAGNEGTAGRPENVPAAVAARQLARSVTRGVRRRAREARARIRV